MEFKQGRCLLITQSGRLFDRARIERITETGDGRILHLVSCSLCTELLRYKIGEDSTRNYAWRLIADDCMLCFDERAPPLTLEQVS